MAKHPMGWLCTLCLLLPLAAQQNGGQEPGSRAGNGSAAARPQPGAAARAALAVARDLAARVQGTEGEERLRALQAAAESYDRIVADFAAEPSVAAQAAFAAGELWRRHDSQALAERDFLTAARLDPERYAQRGRLEAADAQRRQQRLEEALQSYAAAAAADPATARAQQARLWQGRLLQQLGRGDDAITQFRSALETAATPRQILDTCNLLARALVQQGDLDGAAAALAHADRAVAAAIEQDGTQAERLERALEQMSARRELQRARDKKAGAAKDAEQLEQALRR